MEDGYTKDQFEIALESASPFIAEKAEQAKSVLGPEESQKFLDDLQK